MRKALLISALCLAATTGFAQSIAKTTLSRQDVKPIKAAQSTQAVTQTKLETTPLPMRDVKQTVKTSNKRGPRKLMSDGVFYSKPKGTLYAGWNYLDGQGGRGYYFTTLVSPAFMDLTFTNKSDGETTWSINGNDASEEVVEGNYVSSYLRSKETDGASLYYAPTVQNEAAEYTLGEYNYLLKRGYTETLGIIRIDSMTCMWVADPRGATYDVDSKTYYGPYASWGALDTDNLYGVGGIDGYGKANRTVQVFDKPASPLFINAILVEGSSFSQPIAEGAQLKAHVTKTKVVTRTYSDGSTEDVITADMDNILATFVAEASDTLDFVSTSTRNKKTIYTGEIVFNRPGYEDILGNSIPGSLVIEDEFAIVIDGLDQEGIDVGFDGIEVEEYDDQILDGQQFFDSGQMIRYNANIAVAVALYGMYDRAVAPSTPNWYTFEDENLDYRRVRVPVEGSAPYENDYGWGNYTDGSEGSPFVKDDETLTGWSGVPVFTAVNWFDEEENSNYEVIGLPDWIESVNVDPSFGYGMNQIFFYAQPLPEGMKGRMAKVRVVGQMEISDAEEIDEENAKYSAVSDEIIIIQGEVDDEPGEFEPFAFDGADGKYYLVNVATNKCWGAGNSWGTQASLVEHPEYVTLLKQPDGTYQLESQVSNGGTSYYFNGDFMDNGSPVNLTITATGIIGYSDDEETVPVYGYTIANGENYFGWDGETTVLGKNLAADSENALWVIATEEETIASLAEATEDEPVDATFLLLDPNFSRNNRNQSAWTGDDFGVGGDNTNFNAEKWGGNSQTFDISQTVNVPNGLYKISFNGFYRYNNTTDNTNDVAIAAHADGTEVINSFIYINGNDYPLTSIADEAASAALEGKLPFSQAEASAAFGQGLYAQTVTVIVNDGKLTVGIKKVNHPGCDWTVWDNFTLLYYGATENNPDEPALVAPEGWTCVVSNGNLAGNSAVNYIAKEYPSTEPVPANIVDGAGKNNSRGIVVKSQDKVNEAWDSQFWIKVNEKLPEGTKLHVEFDYKADNAGSVGTQSHGAPGAYQHWAAIGNVEFDVDWKHFSTDVTVEGAMADMESIAFNLNDVATANTYYFDNFGVWVQKPAPVEDWVNILKNSEMEDAVVKNFFSKEYPSEQILPAKIVDGVGVDGSRGIEVDAAAKVANDWDSQFWIYLPATLPQGTKYKVEFDYRADRNASADTQAHGEPGNYIFYDMIGSPSFTTEWQHFVKEGSISASQAVNADNSDITFRSIAFNLAKDSENAVKFFFDNVKFFVENAFVETGIVNVNNSNKNEDAIYNLRGQKVQQAQKGLYIINGKKVVK